MSSATSAAAAAAVAVSCSAKAKRSRLPVGCAAFCDALTVTVGQAPEEAKQNRDLGKDANWNR
ncbi:MAG: hypothetical protein Kow00114_11610 [Kiloniellaceae bacterium]